MQVNKGIFKVALVQYSAVPNNIGANMEGAVRFIRKAKEQGADLVLFPEMWSNGYGRSYKEADAKPLDASCVKDREFWMNSAVDDESFFIKSMRSAAKESDIAVVMTYLSRGSRAPRNSAVVIDRSGGIALKYSKVHTCDFAMESMLESGTEFGVCEVDGVKLGVMICFDREFPESARVLMLKGAELILVPNACGMNPARLNQLSTRAFENMVGVAMANYPGPRHGQSCAFSPIVFNPEGGYVDNTLLMADDVTEDIFMVPFDMAAIRDYRRREVWGNAYRKVNAYGDLLSPTVNEPFLRSRVK